MRARRCLCIAYAAVASASKPSSATHSRLLCPVISLPRSSRADLRTIRLASAAHTQPLSTSASEHLRPRGALQRRTLSDAASANVVASSAASDSENAREIVASGMRLLENKDVGAAVELLERFEHGDNVAALSALGRALLAAAQSVGDLENADDQSELALQLKQSIRKLARANSTGKSGGCRSSTAPRRPTVIFTSRLSQAPSTLTPSAPWFPALCSACRKPCSWVATPRR
jgi:hypothetical protein